MINRRQFVTATGASALGLQIAACQPVLSTPARLINLQPDPERPDHGYAELLNILDYGAVGDATTLNTDAIQQAIDEASRRDKGARVVIPQGTFLTGHLELKSGVELHLSADATLLGSTDIHHYHKTARNWYALISAHRAENIAISGKGTIDGQGRELALKIRDMHLTGERPTPKFNYRRMRANEAERPQLIECFQCSNIRIYDLAMKDAAMWVQTYEQCSQLAIDNIRVDSDAYWNNDGIDIVDSQDVRITNSFVNAADDAICLKSETPGLANNRVLIRNCTVRSSASGVKFGTSSKGGFKNISIEDITVYDTYRSAIALECVDGGDLENVAVSNVVASNTGNAIFVRLGHRNKDGQVGTLKNVVIKNVKAEIPFGRPDIDYELRGPALNQFFNPIPASITGIPGHRVHNIALENIEISYPGRASKGMAYIPVNHLDWVPEKESEYPEYSMFGELPAWALYVRHATGIKLKDVTFKVREEDFRPALIFDDVNNIAVSGANIAAIGEHRQLVFNNSHRANLTNIRVNGQPENDHETLGNSSGIRVY